MDIKIHFKKTSEKNYCQKRLYKDARSIEEQNKYNSKERGRSRNRKCDEVYKKVRKKTRSESPPPKKNRRKKGINSGKAKCCSHCRPEISNRFYRQSEIRKIVSKKNLNNIIEFGTYYQE